MLHYHRYPLNNPYSLTLRLQLCNPACNLFLLLQRGFYVAVTTIFRGFVFKNDWGSGIWACWMAFLLFTPKGEFARSEIHQCIFMRSAIPVTLSTFTLSLQICKSFHFQSVRHSPQRSYARLLYLELSTQ